MRVLRFARDQYIEPPIFRMLIDSESLAIHLNG